MPSAKPTLRCPCDEQFLETRSDFIYDARPPGEVRYELPAPYRREYRHCTLCGHWFSKHDYDFAAFYNGAYVDASYGDGLRRAFERIMALPRDRSDNYHRVERIADFAKRMVVEGRARRLLDVGSGLAVFPALMKKRGWNCTALDPDPRAVDHAKEVVGVDGARQRGNIVQKILSILGPAFFAVAICASADTIAQWNFNSVPPDANNGSGTDLPSIGNGFASLLNGVTAIFSDGSTNDPAPSGDDSGWSTTHYPTQATSNKTAGVQFNVSTVGYSNIVIRWDQRTTVPADRRDAPSTKT